MIRRPAQMRANRLAGVALVGQVAAGPRPRPTRPAAGICELAQEREERHRVVALPAAGTRPGAPALLSRWFGVAALLVELGRCLPSAPGGEECN